MMVTAGVSMDKRLSKEIQILGNDLAFLSALAGLFIFVLT